jgi:hypothetical protein
MFVMLAFSTVCATAEVSVCNKGTLASTSTVCIFDPTFNVTFTVLVLPVSTRMFFCPWVSNPSFSTFRS